MYPFSLEKPVFFRPGNEGKRSIESTAFGVCEAKFEDYFFFFAAFLAGFFAALLAAFFLAT
ncbi:MAG: hypothetical protein KF774_19875 [Planctomyces sp.]|nr:hypothetical protein [Planctomyces sp.]